MSRSTGKYIRMSVPAKEVLSQCMLSLSVLPSIIFRCLSPSLCKDGDGSRVILSSTIQREATIEVVFDAIQHVDLVDNYAIVINKVPKDADRKERLKPCQPITPNRALDRPSLHTDKLGNGCPVSKCVNAACKERNREKKQREHPGAKTRRSRGSTTTSSLCTGVFEQQVKKPKSKNYRTRSSQALQNFPDFHDRLLQRVIKVSSLSFFLPCLFP